MFKMEAHLKENIIISNIENTMPEKACGRRGILIDIFTTDELYEEIGSAETILKAWKEQEEFIGSTVPRIGELLWFGSVDSSISRQSYCENLLQQRES